MTPTQIETLVSLEDEARIAYYCTDGTDQEAYDNMMTAVQAKLNAVAVLNATLQASRRNESRL